MSIPIEAPPSSPGHAGHTPQPWANLGLSLGRLHDLAGGIFGSAIVRAMIGAPESAGTLAPEPMQEYAMQPFGIPGGMERGSPSFIPSAKVQQASHAATLLSLEESTIRFSRSNRTNATVPEQVRAAIEQVQTWGAGQSG